MRLRVFVALASVLKLREPVAVWRLGFRVSGFRLQVHSELRLGHQAWDIKLGAGLWD
jgi:hypothetical protein